MTRWSPAPSVLEQAERIIAAAQSSEQATRGDIIPVTLFVARALAILAAISRNVTAILGAYGNLLTAWANSSVMALKPFSVGCNLLSQTW